MENEKIKLPLSVKVFISVLIVGTVLSIISTLYTSFTDIYNKSTGFNLEYKALEQNQITTWDNYYLTFKEKATIADINKETFITVTSIIMQSRADGENVSWKWVQENQNIPYDEFTVFYKELSSFVSVRFTENAAIEKSKQQIVKNHNYLIMTYPGMLYNYFLNIPEMKYKAGFVSDETKLLFENK